MKTRRPRARTFWGLLSLLGAGGLAGTVLAYRWFGLRVLEAAYREESIGPLNALMRGRDHTPLSAYVADIDVLLANAVAVGLVCEAFFLWRWWRAGRSGSAPGGLSRGRRWLFRVFATGLALVFVGALYLGYYRLGYVPGLRSFAGARGGDVDLTVFPELAPEEVLQLGWAHTEEVHPATSYLLRDEEKAPGTLRIGTFGCSFTEGDEAAFGHDMPSFLERQLRAAGHDVEVVNFGVRGYGMHQSYLMWETLGREYDLDVTVLMAFTSHFRRDETFLYDGNTSGPLHARYLVDDGEVRQQPVLGEDRIDAARRYFRILPPLAYLRFDSRTPTLLRPLVSGGTRDRWNPAYYRDSIEGEALTTYRTLFDAMARESERFVLVALEPELADALEGHLPPDRSSIVRTQVDEVTGPLSSLYLAPEAHWSALGYEFVASEIAAMLEGRPRPSGPRLRIEPLRTVEGSIPRLDTLSDVRLMVGDAPAAHFLRRRSLATVPGKFEERVRFAEDGVASLLAVERSEGEIVYLPLAAPLADGAPMQIELGTEDGLHRVALGAVRGHGPGLGSLEWAPPPPEDGPVRIVPGDYGVRVLVDEALGLHDARVTVGDEVVLEGEVREQNPALLPAFVRGWLFGREGARAAHFRPRVADYVGFRAVEGDYVDLRALGAGRHTVDLVGTTADGATLRVPLLALHVERYEGPPFAGPLDGAFGAVARHAGGS